MGAWAFIMLTFTVATKTLPFLTAFSAFRNEVIWLIVVAFFFAKGFEKCGLGSRIANLFVKWMGKSTLGLAYGLTMAEACIAPAMPSTSARAGAFQAPVQFESVLLCCAAHHHVTFEVCLAFNTLAFNQL